ncbi:MAG TPA: hypothetical protein VFW66_00630 [Gemmatimonadales bacterium]|nr:hypothetical protein [Gemmatimonadales bacterium]
MAALRGPAVPRALGAVAILLIVTPLVDLVGTVLPLRPSEVAWRFGTYGLLTSALVTPIVGLALLLALGAMMERRGLLLTVAVVSGVLVVIVLGWLALFVLDFIQLRQAVAIGNKASYDAAAVKAAVYAAVEAITLAFLAFGISDTRRWALPAHGTSRGQPLGLVAKIPVDEGY